MNNYIYRLRLEYDEIYQDYNTLQEVFDVLKEDKHITILHKDTDKAQFLDKISDENEIDIIKYPFYIETSISADGDFYESVEFWIENYLIEEFYYPDHRPYIEVLVNN